MKNSAKNDKNAKNLDKNIKKYKFICLEQYIIINNIRGDLYGFKF